MSPPFPLILKTLPPPPPHPHSLAINNSQSLMYDNVFKTEENKIKLQRDKIEPQHVHPKTEIILDQGNYFEPIA